MPTPKPENDSLPPPTKTTTEVPSAPTDTPPVEEVAETEEIVEEATNDEIDLTAAIVKAYRKGVRNGKKTQGKKVPTQTRKQKLCFWCGWDRDCAKCVREDNALASDQ